MKLIYPQSFQNIKNNKHIKLQVFFNKNEINKIISIYSKNVTSGNWFDYSVEQKKNEAVFNIFGKKTLIAKYRIIKRQFNSYKFQVLDSSGKIISMSKEIDKALFQIDKDAQGAQKKA